MKIIVLGYMASGKSTISKILANKLKINTIDLDNYIAEKEGDTIKNIFLKKGEIYFRKIENIYLKELLNGENDFVLALGGGTPCYANNMDLITKMSTSIYLKANLNTLYKRLRIEKVDRPLISNLNDNKLKEFIAKHLFERAGFYKQASIHVSIDDKSINSIVEEIRDRLS
jgi:shikimate kinase